MSHFTRSCQGKIRYGHKQTAEHSVREMVKKNPTRSETLSAYECKFCKGWHIGNKHKFRLRITIGRKTIEF